MARIFARIIIVIAAVTVGSPLVAQMDTIFTYQGELNENGGPANGFYNLDFSLWDAASAGNQIGNTIMLNGLTVTDGRFSAELDFGADSFDNSNRWLEISVNGTELTPRHPITRAPYAIQTRGIFVDDLGQIGVGTTIPGTAFDVVGGEVRAKRSDTQQQWISMVSNTASGHFLFGHSRLSNKKGLAIANVWEDDGGPPAGAGDILFRTGNEFASTEVMRVTESGRVGIGTATPDFTLDISSSTNAGVRVETSGTFGDGVTSIVDGTAAFAIYGIDLSGNGRAGRFIGDVAITGTLSKTGGSFKIDHPLDPANKFLSHSFVESPDMMNIYNGNAILDGSGRATITLPDWFEALNREFRYQLTCIGGFATVYIESEIENNQFTIAGGNAGLKVSWQVTGVRQDAWAEANRIPVEEQKVGFEAGHYLHPEVYDLDRSMSILAARDAHISVPEPTAVANKFQEEKQIEATASRNTGKFHTPHIKRARQK